MKKKVLTVYEKNNDFISDAHGDMARAVSACMLFLRKAYEEGHISEKRVDQLPTMIKLPEEEFPKYCMEQIKESFVSFIEELKNKQKEAGKTNE